MQNIKEAMVFCEIQFLMGIILLFVVAGCTTGGDSNDRYTYNIEEKLIKTASGNNQIRRQVEIFDTKTGTLRVFITKDLSVTYSHDGSFERKGSLNPAGSANPASSSKKTKPEAK